MNTGDTIVTRTVVEQPLPTAYYPYTFQTPTTTYTTYEPYGPNHNIIWPIIGAAIVALAISLFYILLRRVVNLILEVYHIVSCKRNFLPQALTFVGGLLIAGGIFFDIFGYNYISGINPFGPKQTIQRHTSVYGFALAGLLMGLGGKLIQGDLHAHGYVQIARHNKRSIIALIVFLLFGIIGGTLAVNNVIPIFTDGNRNPFWNISHYVSANICIAVGVIFIISGFVMRKNDVANMSDVVKEIFTIFALSFILGCGLLLSGITRRQNVLHGFSIFSRWTPVLLVPIAVTMILTFIIIMIGSKFRDLAIWGDNYFVIIDEKVTGALIIGACLFGFGWGLCGMELTSWILHFPVFTLSACIFYGVFLIGGIYVADFMQQRIK